MKKRFYSAALAVFMLVFSIMAGTQISTASASAATTGNPACAGRFLTFPVWYRGLTVSSSDCNLKPFSGSGKDSGIGTYVGVIALNVIEMVLQLIGYISAFFIIYGGFIYMTQGSEQNKIEQAKKTILNAVVGLVVSIFSIAIVNLIFTYIIK